MEPKIIIHDDFCADMSIEDIQDILSEVAEVITKAILCGTKEPDDFDPAA